MRSNLLVAPRTLFVVILLTTVASCSSPNKPSQSKGPATLASLSLTGSTSFVSVGQTSQLSAFGNYSDGSRQNVTAQVTWTVGDSAIATVSASGVLKTSGYGSTSVTATLQSMSASMTIQVTLQQTGLTLSTTVLTMAAAGETAQLTATATYVDGSTKDVTSLAAWTSDSAQIASVSGGLVTANSLGAAHVTARYPTTGQQFNRLASVVVTPPGTFVATGGARDPGAGPLSGVTVVHQPSGRSVTSTSSGFSLGGLTDGILSFSLPNYESASVDTSTVTGEPLRYFDVPMQPVTRISAGASVNRTIAPHDMDYVVASGVHCYPCQLVRVTTASSGLLHLEMSWSESHSIVNMWINGRLYPGANVGPSSVLADLEVTGGEVLVYVGQISNTKATYVPFTLASQMQGAALGPSATTRAQ